MNVTSDALEIVPLASGSAGNATLLRSGRDLLLIDAGLSADEIDARLSFAGVAPGRIGALALTHRHGDHVRGAAAFAARHKTRVFATRRTARALGTEAQRRVARIVPREWFEHGPFRLMPVPLRHDAPETVAFLVECGGRRYGHATDLGCDDGDVGELLAGCDALLLEFNHDRGLLDRGPYPPHLKRRIAGPEGHLANDEAAALLRRLAHPGLAQVWLAHLSRHNNTPELALAAARAALPAGCAPRLVVAAQDAPSAGFSVSAAAASPARPGRRGRASAAASPARRPG